MKKLTALLIVCFLLFSLTACGGGTVDPNDPNQGLWTATKGEMMGLSMEVSEFFGEGFTIELQSDGKCALNVDGEKANGTWTLSGGAFTVKGGGLDCAGRLENGGLTLENVLDMGLNLVFEKEGGGAAATATPDTSADAAPTADAASGEVGYYVIESFTQGGDTLDAATLQAIGMAYYLIINEDGTTVLYTDALYNGTWESGVLRYGDSGEEMICDYTLDGDLLTMDVDGGVVTLVFKRSNDAPPPPSEGGDTTVDAPAGELSEYAAWWDGAWYGWYSVLEGVGPTYEYMNDLDLDCYAYIDLSDDGTGTLYLWDDYEELGTVEFELGFENDAPMGQLSVLGGELFFQELEPYEWYIDPTEEGYVNCIYLYEDARLSNDDYMRFELYLKPWGDQWYDMPEDLLPPYFQSWYIDEGFCDYSSMLDALADSTLESGAPFIHPGLPARAYD